MTDKSKALAELRESISQLDLPLKATATNLVFGKGNPNTDILFIGEAPGKFEDLQGIPFVGTAGKLLDEMLNKINLTINDIYIANILKYRPPNNREPQPDEISAHTPFLVEQIKIIKPKIIVTLGNYATKFILGGCSVEQMNNVPGITQLHGKEKHIIIAETEYRVMPMYHPAALIYDRSLRPTADEDFKKIRDVLGQKNLLAF
ncbi:MAG TPA: uracil-DNA glycosylase [Candidatus Nanoarchaeia archaeon]|nr:uracil-DNA glycosylase [Candidatus Nanoarchaeia archaeon]